MRGCGIVFALALSVALPICAAQADDAPDIVYFNGKIATLDAAGMTAEAVAIKDGRFVAVGANAAIRATAGPATTLVDLGGRTK